MNVEVEKDEFQLLLTSLLSRIRYCNEMCKDNSPARTAYYINESQQASALFNKLLNHIK